MSLPYRHEFKYRLHAHEAAVLEHRARGILRPDPHAGARGSYLVRSLYFDDPYDGCFYETEDGCDRRAKYRIRYYNEDTTYLRLEKKSKERGMTRKTVFPITREQCQVFLSGRIPAVTADMEPGLKALLAEMTLRSLKPKVIVVYERVPFLDPVGNVRVTFDRHLLSGQDIGGFLEPSRTLRPVFPTGESLLEVKWDELLPSYLKDHLTLGTLQWDSFSKYYLCRKYNCHGGIRI